MSERYGSYELVKKLATGGMAQIYLARHLGIEGFERLCVVKRILPHLAENEDFVQMFLDEAKIAARLNHPNIVQIYDLGDKDDTYYIAMEYIHGEDLRRMWRKAEAQGDNLPVPLVLRIIADAASGLDYAHKRTDHGRPLGIVHRDISPQNILVSFEGTVKVVDFGIAKAADKATHTRSGVLKGKYSYMSPEQAGGSRDVDRRTDIFALGVVLYELLTGTRLFKRTNDVQTLQAVMSCEVTPPSEVHARVPRSLDDVVLKALTRKPEDRYPDALSLQLALENWLIENQQPSSTAHVAAYMKELYADRLANEAPNGMPVSEEVRTPSSRSGRSPSGQGGRDRPPAREAGPASSSAIPAEPTTSLRPDRPDRPSRPSPRPSRSLPSQAPASLPSAPLVRGGGARPVDLLAETSPRVTEVSRTVGGTKKATKRSGMVAAIGAVAILAIVAGGLAYFAGGDLETRFAQVSVETDPPGARLVWDGVDVPQATPTVLPERKAGAYALRVAKDGFRDEVLTVKVPASGSVKVGPVKLSSLASQTGPVDSMAKVTPPTNGNGFNDATASATGNGTGSGTGTDGAGADRDVVRPAPRADVELELVTEPAGATITVNGRAEGVSPARVKVAAGTQLQVRAELAGHLPVDRRIPVGEANVREVLKLERRRAAWSTAQGSGTGQGNTTKQAEVTNAVATTARGTGAVQFVIVPLGASSEYSCGGQGFRPTPFEPVQLPAGTHDCTFRHPELGVKRPGPVEVKANDTVRFTVRFD